MSCRKRAKHDDDYDRAYDLVDASGRVIVVEIIYDD